MTISTPRLEEQVCFAIYSASHALTRRYSTVLKDLGLTYPQYLVMLALWEDESLTVKELGTKLHLNSGTLSPLLKRLHERGLLTRERDSHDERRLVITLTDTGRHMEPQACAIQESVSSATGLFTSDLLTLRDLATQLTKNMA